MDFEGIEMIVRGVDGRWRVDWEKRKMGGVLYLFVGVTAKFGVGALGLGLGLGFGFWSLMVGESRMGQGNEMYKEHALQHVL